MLASTNKKYVALEPIIGSGTVWYVEKKLNKDFAGIKKEKKHFNIAKSE